MKSTQIAVIGAGPGGYAAAFMAADLGMKVTLVDRQPNPGGVCLYRGCIPSKTYLHVAKLLTESREAAQFGIDFAEPRIDIDKLRGWKDSVVQKMTGGLGQLCKSRDVDFMQGSATFQGPRSLLVETDGQTEEVTFEHAILATGSRPTEIPSLSLDSPRVMNSTSALALPDIPKSLLIIGGGYIGLELGTVYSALGTEVTVVEMTSGLLPGADRDLVSVLARRIKQQFHEVLLETEVTHIYEVESLPANGDSQGSLEVHLEGANRPAPKILVDKVLIAVGRTPNTANLGIENTRIQVDEQGFIKIDEKRETDEPGIYAIGDIAGQPMLAHKASHEGRIAAEAIAGHKVAFEAQAIPAVVFTDPELAWCGLTETEAKAQSKSVEVARFPWGASGRASTLGRNDGITKLVLDPETEQVLGVGIVGSGAGELIAEGVLAVEMAAVAADIKLSIHAHPTLSETIMESAEMFFGQSTHVHRPKKKR